MTTKSEFFLVDFITEEDISDLIEEFFTPVAVKHSAISKMLILQSRISAHPSDDILWAASSFFGKLSAWKKLWGESHSGVPLKPPRMITQKRENVFIGIIHDKLKRLSKRI